MIPERVRNKYERGSMRRNHVPLANRNDNDDKDRKEQP